MLVMCKRINAVALHMKTHTLLLLPPGRVSGLRTLSGVMPHLAAIVTRHSFTSQCVESAPRHGHIAWIIGS
jgi:hypothetical protein